MNDIYLHIVWSQDGERREAAFGPFAPEPDFSHQQRIHHFAVRWKAVTDVIPDEVVLVIPPDPARWTAEHTPTDPVDWLLQAQTGEDR